MRAARGRGHPHLLRLDRGAEGRLADRRGGRGRHADRLQRRRQVDDAALDLRPDAGQRRARSASAGEDITRVPAARDRRPAGSRSSPEGRHCFPRMTVRENLDLGALPARGGPEIADDLERVFDAVPAPAGAREAEGGHDVRRRAADAGHRPRADGPAAAAAARRAVDGHRADPRRSASTRRSREINRDGRDDPAGRAERQLRARTSSERGYVLETGRVVARQRLRRSCATTPRSSGPTWDLSSDDDPRA